MNSVDRIETLLRETMGLDVQTIGGGALERAVRSRLAQHGHEDIDSYWLALQHSSTELQALIEAVVVPETWFFRHREAFVTLGKLAREALVKRQERRSLRLLSLPCSTGEEPYSMAMALFDAGLHAGQFDIDAVDISARSLALAQQAVYGRNSFRGAAGDLAFRERYFTSTQEGHRLADAVRAQVRFLQGNLFDETLCVGLGTYDFIFCRNMLIYFDRPMQARAITTLAQRLKLGGTLFAGPAEGGALTSVGLVSAGYSQSFAFHVPVPAQWDDVLHRLPTDVAAPTCGAGAMRPMAAAWYGPMPMPSRAPVDLPPLPGVVSPAVSRWPTMDIASTESNFPRSFAASRKRIDAPDSGHASTASPAMPVAFQVQEALEYEATLAEAARLADSGQLERAAALCRSVLAEVGANAQAEYLLGLVCDAAGDVARAHAHYRRALYLEPEHYEALVHSAALLNARGDTDGAQRLLARAERVTSSATPSGGGR